MATSKDQTLNSWHRWFRRSNVYIAEYILMLVLVASFVAVLVSLWFSFFGLVYSDSAVSVVTAASQIGAMLVVGPAAFWLYARVTGQEGVQTELYERKSRTVFLTIWMFFMVLALVGMVASIVSSFVNAMFGLESDFGAALVTKVLPGLLAVATVGFALFMVVKHTSRKFVMMAALVLTVMALVLLIANVTMVLVRKDSSSRRTPTTPTWMQQPSTQPNTYSSDCTFSKYLSKDCSYSEYLEDSRSSSSSSNSRLYN